MVRTFKLKPWVYAGLLALSPMTADAAGLGRLTVTSALGQPLRAEIELVSVQKDELASIAARLASADAFKEARLERSVSLLDIKFSVEQKADGVPVIRLATTQPVNEPFLDMLVELNWAAGRLLREYTVLLDPPGFSASQAAQSVAAPTVKTAAASALQAGGVAPSPAASAKGDEGKPARAGKPESKPREYQQGTAEAGSYGPVKKGETLTAIASQLKPEGYSLEQMLVALYQSNAQAFSGKNMHRLKAGQILRVPEEQQVASVGRAEARHELKAHTADWNAYRQKLAAAVDEAPAPKDEVPKQIAKGKITTAVEDKAAPPPAASKDVLKVTKGEAAGGKEIQSLQSKVQSLQEETTAREKSLKEANERISSLEKNIKEMQQLLELKNKSLADLQKQAEVKPAPVPAPKAEEKPAEAPAKPVEPVAAPAEAPKPEPEKPVVKPKVEPVKPKPAVEPVAESGLLDELTGNSLYLAGAAGALALLGGGALFAINRRRRKSLSSFEDSILTGGDLKANTVFGETAGGVVDTGDTSFLTDFSQGGLGTIDTNDVDPIAEAEVYMAYGRDAQAEEILKEAMAKDPGRHEIQLKLLEIYAARKNLIAFETLAGELYAAIGGQSSPLWDKAAEMGRALDPNNPLYGAHEGGAARDLPATAAVVAPVAAAAVFGGVDLNEPTQGLMEADAEDMSPDLDFGVDEAAAEDDVEAEMPSETLEAFEAPNVAQEPAEDEAGVLEFNLDAFAEEPAATVTSAEAAPASEADQALEFDLGDLIPPQPMAEAAETETGGLEIDLDTLMAPSEAVEAPVEAAAEKIQDFSFDLPESEPSALVETPALPETDEESIVIGSAPEAEEENHLDFNFDLESEAPGVTEEKASPAMPELDLSGISLDLEEPAAVAGVAEAAMGEGGGAEVATKLDLARAYVEMGDKEGAKEILEEVLKEGNSQQQADANQLLASL
jgi:pilus assembly protein FimV